MTLKKMALTLAAGVICGPLPALAGDPPPEEVITSTLCVQNEYLAGCEIAVNEPFPDDPDGNERIFVMTRNIPKPAPAGGEEEEAGEYTEGDCPSGSCALLGYRDGKLLYANTIVSYPASAEAACSYGANGTGESCYAEGSTVVHLVDGGSSWHWQELNVWEVDPQPRRTIVIDRAYHQDMYSNSTTMSNGVRKKEWSLPLCEKAPDPLEEAAPAGEEVIESTEAAKQRAELLRPVMEKVLAAYAESVKKMDLKARERSGGDAYKETPPYANGETPVHAYTVVPQISSSSFDMANWGTAPFPAKALRIGGEDAGDGYQHFGSTVPYSEAGFRIVRLSDKDFLLELSGVSGSGDPVDGDALWIEASKYRARYGVDDCVEPFEPYGWTFYLKSEKLISHKEEPLQPSIRVSRAPGKPDLTRVLVSFPEEMPYFSFDYWDRDNGGRSLSTIKRNERDGNALGD